MTDAITAILLLLLNGNSGEAYNICNDKESRSVYEIARLVAGKVANGKINVIVEPIEDMGYAPDVNMYLISDKLKMLGWEAAVDMEEAYKRLAECIEKSKRE